MAVERLTGLDPTGYRQMRRGETHGPLVFEKIFVAGAEAGYEFAAVHAAEVVRLRPFAVANALHALHVDIASESLCQKRRYGLGAQRMKLNATGVVRLHHAGYTAPSLDLGDAGRPVRIHAMSVLGPAWRQARGAARYFHRVARGAPGEVVVHQAARLHQCVERRRADKAKATALERARERDGLGHRCGYVGPGRVRPLGWRRRVREDQRLEWLAGGAQADRGTGVGECRLDLRAVTDGTRVGKEARDIGVAEARHRVGMEPGERRPERVALGKNGPPREPGCEGLQRELLEQPALVKHGKAPFLVVVALKERVAVPPAARTAHHANTRDFPALLHRATTGRPSHRPQASHCP